MVACIKERLDQDPSSTGGPKTDMSRPGMEARPPRWKVSTLAKSYSNSLLLYGTPSYELTTIVYFMRTL